MAKATITYAEGEPAYAILKSMPPARRSALLRSAEDEILALLESVHNSVGMPKIDGKWNSALCLDLEAVRQKLLHPTPHRVKQSIAS